MYRHFDLFSDGELSADALKSRLVLKIEKDLPSEFDYRELDSTVISLGTMWVIRDNETNDYYGILFTALKRNGNNQLLITINGAELDNRLREQNLISEFVQKIINEHFREFHEIDEMYLQWNNNVHRCFEEGIRVIANMCAADIISDRL